MSEPMTVAERDLNHAVNGVDYGERPREEHRALVAADRAHDAERVCALADDHIGNAGAALAAAV